MGKKNSSLQLETAPEAAKAFMELIEAHRYQKARPHGFVPLTNITVWAGAGFSKSWTAKAPDATQLFTLDADALESVADLGVLSRLFGVQDSSVTPEQLRQVVYQLDMYERYPEICPRYIDAQNLNIMRGGIRAAVLRKYDSISKLNYFDNMLNKFPLTNEDTHQTKIIDFFKFIHRCATGWNGIAEGIRCHFLTTNYDFVIETILDHVLNLDDSLFNYTYRGFTPSSIARFQNPMPTHEHWLSWHLIKLNGGFEILADRSRYRLDYNKRNEDQIINQPPILMLPSREQDYSDPYFRTIFPKSVRLMRETKVLLLVGYSLPEDDALMRFILRQFAEEPEDGFGKAIFYVDLLSKDEKVKRLQSIFPSIAKIEMPKIFTFEGSFANFAKECVFSLIK